MYLFKGESLLVLGGAFDTLIDGSALVSFEKARNYELVSETDGDALFVFFTAQS